MTGRLMTQAEYLIEEAREEQMVREFEEWDCDETSFKDEGEITIEDLKTSPALKVQYGRFISATNWNRWMLGC